MSAPNLSMENDDNRFDTLFSRVGRDCQLLIVEHLTCSDLCRFAISPRAHNVDWENIATRCEDCDDRQPSLRDYPVICNRPINNAADLGAVVSLQAVSRAQLMQKACKRCFDFCEQCNTTVCTAHSDVCKTCELPSCSDCSCCCDKSDEYYSDDGDHDYGKIDN
jgi:hypothetical protein